MVGWKAGWKVGWKVGWVVGMIESDLILYKFNISATLE